MKRLVAALSFAVLAAGSPLTAAAQDVTLRLNSWLPPSHPIVRDMIMPWAAEVEAATEGRVTVQLLDSPLGPPPAAFDLVQTGAVDLAYSVNGYTPGRFGLTDLVELPFLTRSATASSVAYQRLHDAMLADQDEFAGVKVLGVFTHSPGIIFTRDADAQSLADLSGKKMRIAGLVTSELAEGLDMVPVQAPSSQVYEMLSNGVTDGIFFIPESVPFFRIDDILRKGFEVDGGFYNVAFFFGMNPASFDKLSEADQAAIEKLSGEAFARRAGQAWEKVDAAARASFPEKGIEMVTIGPDDMARAEAAAEPIYARVRQTYADKGVDFEAALAMFRAEADKVAAE